MQMPMSDADKSRGRLVRIRRLLEEMIHSGKSAEEVCGDHPDVLTDVKRMSEDIRAVEAEIELLFPVAAPADRMAARHSEVPLPKIPGYHIERELGRGGMGVVYEARHVSLNRKVAIKVPLAGAFAATAERVRNQREAQAIASLEHPNIIKVYDVGEFEGRPYFTMELIDGIDLGKRLANTPQPSADAAALVATLAEAVHYAHQSGIIHRDLKPANVLITADGAPKITDFGLSRHSGSDATLAVGSIQFGTPSYMAPEQVRGSPGLNGPSVDIYSLGSILYELLTGRPPFRGETAVETVRQVLEDEPTPPSRLNSRTPRDLETICLKCLRKDPRDRYPSAAAFALDVRRFLGGEPIEARPVGSPERLYRWTRRHPARAALVLTGVCVVAAGVGVGFWMQHLWNQRASESASREGRARQAIESAVLLANELREKERWTEARHVLDDARAYGPEAGSAELLIALDDADRHLSTAWELDEIRRRYPESSDTGFDYSPAAAAYRRVFARLGFGEDVPVDAAARIVDGSPIREQLLTALDNAAFVARVIDPKKGLERPLAIARTADPDPWRDRFRHPASWFDRDALLALRDTAAVGSDMPPAHQIVIVGVLLGGLGAHDEAIQLLRDVHRVTPTDFWVNLELGNALVRVNRTKDAAHYFRAAATIQPQNPGPWVTLGSLLNHSGSLEEAIVAVRHATELNPRSLPAWRNYVTYLGNAGRIEDARDAILRASEQNPDHSGSFDDMRIGLRVESARRHAARGDWSAALGAYRSVLPDDSNDAEFWFEAAAIQLIAGDRDGYLRTRDAMPERCRPSAMRAFLIARASTLEPAPGDLVDSDVASSETELLRSPSMFWSLRQRGALSCRAGRDVEAIAFFEQSLAANSSTGRAVLCWLWLAIAFHHVGRTEDAAHWHTKAADWLDDLVHGMPDDAPALGLHLHDWLEAHVLRREADLLLSGTEAKRLPAAR
jgi:tetratricopeptide (TPR) repeat protein